jgi:hypothetical protein
MFEDQAIQHFQRGAPVVLIELPHRLELKLERIVRPALGIIEQQRIGAGGQGYGQLSRIA